MNTRRISAVLMGVLLGIGVQSSVSPIFGACDNLCRERQYWVTLLGDSPATSKVCQYNEKPDCLFCTGNTTYCNPAPNDNVNRTCKIFGATRTGSTKTLCLPVCTVAPPATSESSPFTVNTTADDWYTCQLVPKIE